MFVSTNLVYQLCVLHRQRSCWLAPYLMSRLQHLVVGRSSRANQVGVVKILRALGAHYQLHVLVPTTSNTFRRLRSLLDLLVTSSYSNKKKKYIYIYIFFFCTHTAHFTLKLNSWFIVTTFCMRFGAHYSA